MKSTTTPLLSLRMPESLVDELQLIAQKDHFMDISEEIRYIIKQKYIEYSDPYKAQLNKLRTDLKDEIGKHSKKEQESFIDDIKGLLEELKKENGQNK